MTNAPHTVIVAHLPRRWAAAFYITTIYFFYHHIDESEVCAKEFEDCGFTPETSHKHQRRLLCYSKEAPVFVLQLEATVFDKKQRN